MPTPMARALWRWLVLVFVAFAVALLAYNTVENALFVRRAAELATKDIVCVSIKLAGGPNVPMVRKELRRAHIPPDYCVGFKVPPK